MVQKLAGLDPPEIHGSVIGLRRQQPELIVLDGVLQLVGHKDPGIPLASRAGEGDPQLPLLPQSLQDRLEVGDIVRSIVGISVVVLIKVHEGIRDIQRLNIIQPHL